MVVDFHRHSNNRRSCALVMLRDFSHDRICQFGNRSIISLLFPFSVLPLPQKPQFQQLIILAVEGSVAKMTSLQISPQQVRTRFPVPATKRRSHGNSCCCQMQHGLPNGLQRAPTRPQPRKRAPPRDHTIFSSFN